MSELFPDFIRCVAVIAPASRTPHERLMPFLRFMEQENIRVKLGVNLFAFDDRSYLAATAEERAADFAAAALDPEVDAIIPFRGGFGCAHLLDRIDFNALPAKPIFGYSDLTSLHMALLAHSQMLPVAAPMAGRLPTLLAPEMELHRRCLRLALTPPEQTAEPIDIVCPVFRKGEARGRLAAGNLTVLCSLLGTKFLPDLSGRILVLEDIGEPIYKLDRMLTQLRLSGVLNRIAGLVWGDFVDCGDVAERNLLLRTFSDALGVPAVAEFPFGHGDRLASLNLRRTAALCANGTVRLE